MFYLAHNIIPLRVHVTYCIMSVCLSICFQYLNLAQEVKSLDSSKSTARLSCHV